MNDPASATLRTWRWRVFSATWLSYFGYYFCRKPFYMTKASLQSELGWDAGDLAVVGTTYLLAYAVGQFLAGALGARLGMRFALLLGMTVTMVANAGFGLSTTVGTFAALMFVNGLAQATGWSNNVGVMTFWTSRQERGTVLGLWGTNYQLGGIAANSLAAYMLGAHGYTWAYFAGSVVMLGALLWGVWHLRNTPADVGLPAIPEHPAGADATEIGWTGRVIGDVALVGSFYFCIKFVRYAIWSWAPYIFSTRFRLEGAEAGYLSTLFDLGGFGGVLLAGWLSDRFAGGRRAPVAFGFVLAMIASTTLLLLAGPTSLVLCSVSLFLVGFTLFGPDALMSGAGAAEVGSRRTAVLAVGIVNGMGSFGSVVQELVLGRLLQGDDLRPVFTTLLASSVAAGVLLAALLLRQRGR